MQKNRRLVAKLKPYETGLRAILREDHFQRLAAGRAAEMATLVVVTESPILFVVRYENDQVVCVVQTRRVVESVINDNPLNGLFLAEVNLPPRI